MKTSGLENTVDAYNLFVRSTPSPLDFRKRPHLHGVMPQAIILSLWGGYGYDGPIDTGDAYSSSLVKSTLPNLSVPRSSVSAASLGEYPS